MIKKKKMFDVAIDCFLDWFGNFKRTTWPQRASHFFAHTRVVLLLSRLIKSFSFFFLFFSISPLRFFFLFQNSFPFFRFLRLIQMNILHRNLDNVLSLLWPFCVLVIGSPLVELLATCWCILKLLLLIKSSVIVSQRNTP